MLVLVVIDDPWLEAVELEGLVAVKGVHVREVVAESGGPLGLLLGPAAIRVVLVLDEWVPGLAREAQYRCRVAVVALFTSTIADHNKLLVLIIPLSKMLLKEASESADEAQLLFKLDHAGQGRERIDPMAEQEEVSEGVYRYSTLSLGKLNLVLFVLEALHCESYCLLAVGEERIPEGIVDGVEDTVVRLSIYHWIAEDQVLPEILITSLSGITLDMVEVPFAIEATLDHLRVASELLTVQECHVLAISTYH